MDPDARLRSLEEAQQRDRERIVRAETQIETLLMSIDRLSTQQAEARAEVNQRLDALTDAVRLNQGATRLGKWIVGVGISALTLGTAAAGAVYKIFGGQP